MRIVFAPSGAVLGRQDYVPFGMDLLAGTGLSSEPRFAHLSRDEEAGLDYARTRMVG